MQRSSIFPVNNKIFGRTREACCRISTIYYPVLGLWAVVTELSQPAKYPPTIILIMVILKTNCDISIVNLPLSKRKQFNSLESMLLVCITSMNTISIDSIFRQSMIVLFCLSCVAQQFPVSHCRQAQKG